MATDRPRVQVTLDDQTNSALALLAKSTNRSVSSVAASLITEALEMHEDVLVSNHADARFISTKKFLSHKDAWK